MISIIQYTIDTSIDGSIMPYSILNFFAVGQQMSSWWQKTETLF